MSAYLAEILLKTAVKLLRLSAKSTLEAKCLSCTTSWFSLGRFKNWNAKWQMNNRSHSLQLGAAPESTLWGWMVVSPSPPPPQG